MRKKRGRKSIIFICLFLLVAAVWAWSVWARVYHNPADADDYIRDDSIQDEPDKKITNVLILGVDQDGNDPGRADSIIVMSINQDTGEVALISLPRDSRVEIPGYGLDKINHAMAYKGINLMRATVEKLLGVPIHHYVYTNFIGFKEIVDTVGGITIDVERRIQNPSSKTIVQPGLQTLNGEQALQYVRFRGDREGDFGRMRRQQQFLTALAEEVLQAKSVLKLPALLEQGARHLRTDMSIPQLLAFSKKASSIDFEEVVTITLKGSPANIKGVSYIVLDEQYLSDIITRHLRWETPATLSN